MALYIYPSLQGEVLASGLDFHCRLTHLRLFKGPHKRAEGLPIPPVVFIFVREGTKASHTE
jgi:hypothetical protein